ncbi:hypothetical protein MPRG_27620 [Mycobacterium paragordonae]|uniref:Uncharacterized protein n=1 Tax=Mycobacterium paragordonae TaxID=1389713 RepID=A0ABQ1C5B7_9MYCO|nr:hypothetical protein MPRG_27620 [Mycobacterium paragordonae]
MLMLGNVNAPNPTGSTVNPGIRTSAVLMLGNVNAPNPTGSTVNPGSAPPPC